MYKKTYYEMCVSPHMPSYSTNHNLGAKFGANWHGTFEATALVW